MSTDEKLRNACRDFLALHLASQDEAFIRSKAERSRMEGILLLLQRSKATTFEGIAAKAAVVTAIEGGRYELTLSLCEDIQRLGR